MRDVVKSSIGKFSYKKAPISVIEIEADQQTNSTICILLQIPHKPP